MTCTAKSAFVATLHLTLLSLGCSAGPGEAADAAPIDAAGIDAPRGSCDVGEVEVQGEWVDWDSTPQMFQGIAEAAVSEGAETATTAPNGRAILCLSAGTDHFLDFQEAAYLPMNATLAADALGVPYAARGLTPDRANDLFMLEFGLTRDLGAAQLLLENRADATATVDTLSTGTFEVLGDYTFFANVPVGSGQLNLTVTAPSGQSCLAPATIKLVADSIAFASIHCN